MAGTWRSVQFLSINPTGGIPQGHGAVQGGSHARTHLRLMALPNTVYSERRWDPTMAQKSCPVVTPQQARPPRRCGGKGRHGMAWQYVWVPSNQHSKVEQAAHNVAGLHTQQPAYHLTFHPVHPTPPLTMTASTIASAAWMPRAGPSSWLRPGRPKAQMARKPFSSQRNCSEEQAGGRACENNTRWKKQKMR